MLKLLHIENIAVIESCDIEFGCGFNVLTGETGAGKSIIIDAIGAVLGYRTTRDVVRNGALKASVSAVFDVSSDEAASWLVSNGYGIENGEVIIYREISADGKSSAKINGRPVTASLLKELGVMLINILGQHDSQQLLNVECHSVFIDRFAENENYLTVESEYKEVYSELTNKRQELRRLDIDEAAKARQVEMLKFQISELEAAELVEDEDTALAEKQKLIRESSKLSERVSQAYSAFSGDNGGNGICSSLADVSKALAAVSGVSEKMSKISDSVSEIYYAAEDILEELRELSETLDFSEEEADRVEARLDTLHKLKRKYGSTVAEMLQFLENAKAELNEVEFSEEHVATLTAEIKALETRARSLAEKLLELRCVAARSFEERIMRELSELDMKNAKFIADVKRTDELSERGLDTVEFLLAANLGEPPKPLEKIASGGELSRVMLAMKNALDENDYVETLIFDEIDTGVSGRAAQRIAEKLYKLSIRKQVLCVTHLSQLSAMSDIHFKIEKSEHDGRTYTSVTALDLEGRASELARITAGSAISETTIINAKELLSLAEETKEKIKTAKA